MTNVHAKLLKSKLEGKYNAYSAIWGQGFAESGLGPSQTLLQDHCSCFVLLFQKTSEGKGVQKSRHNTHFSIQPSSFVIQ